MSTLKIEKTDTRAQRVKVTSDTLTVDLTDGRTISVPLAWFPRLLHGSRSERSNWRFIAQGEGVHWTDLDEDISVEGLLAGQQSRESLASLEKWLESRRGGRSSREKMRNIYEDASNQETKFPPAPKKRPHRQSANKK